MARIAFIVANDFEDSEFRVPFDQVRKAGHEAVVLGVKSGEQLKGKKGRESLIAGQAVKNARAEDFAALVIPGGYSPDHLRANAAMVDFVRAFFTAHKPIAAICHAPWMLVEADIVDGYTVTSVASIKTDLLNAGAHWVDREVVEDGGLITSRKPEDLPAFCAALLRQVDQGIAPRLASSTPSAAPVDALPSIH